MVGLDCFTLHTSNCIFEGISAKSKTYGIVSYGHSTLVSGMYVWMIIIDRLLTQEASLNSICSHALDWTKWTFEADVFIKMFIRKLVGLNQDENVGLIKSNESSLDMYLGKASGISACDVSDPSCRMFFRLRIVC